MGLPERGRKAGEYFDFDTVSNEGAILVFRIHKFLPDKMIGKNTVSPVVADILVLTGNRAGTLVENEEIINGGVTFNLRREAEGKEIVRTMGWATNDRSSKPFVAANYPSDEEFAVAEAAYAATNNDPWTATRLANAASPVSRGTDPAATVNLSPGLADAVNAAPDPTPVTTPAATPATNGATAQGALPAQAPWLNKG